MLVPATIGGPPMSARLNRRDLLRTAGGIGAAATLGGIGSLTTGSVGSAAPAGFPDYAYIGQPLDLATLRYNPTGEIIFPCIRGVYDKLSSPLRRYYLYYAPHDPPGGICLAYGDSLPGPFTEYPGN